LSGTCVGMGASRGLPAVLTQKMYHCERENATRRLVSASAKITSQQGGITKMLA
jgi:hypothetical protein